MIARHPHRISLVQTGNGIDYVLPVEDLSAVEMNNQIVNEIDLQLWDKRGKT